MNRASITYEQAFEDHCYLWETYGPADDMTGGYVDQDDLDRLLRNPTKKTARECLCSQIEYWFQTGTDDRRLSVDEIISSDERVLEIAIRHGFKD